MARAAIGSSASVDRWTHFPLGSLTGPIVLMGIAGGTLFSVGLPLLITGSVQRSRYNEWRERHAAAAMALDGLRVSAAPSGGQLGWSCAF